MTEATITSPNCSTAVPLTESLAAPLLAATRKQFEEQLKQKDADISQRELENQVKPSPPCRKTWTRSAKLS